MQMLLNCDKGDGSLSIGGRTKSLVVSTELKKELKGWLSLMVNLLRKSQGKQSEGLRMTERGDVNVEIKG